MKTIIETGDPLPPDPTFEEVKQLFDFMTKHTPCREAHDKRVGGGGTFARAYSIRAKSGSLLTTYWATCTECGGTDTIAGWDAA